MMPPQELADRLMAGGRRAINADRVQKFVRHVENRQHYEDTLACLPEETRMIVEELAERLVRLKVGA